MAFDLELINNASFTGKMAELYGVGSFPGLMGACGSLKYNWFVPLILSRVT